MELLNGFANLFSNPAALGFVVLGAIVGTIFGALPGLTAAAAIAMLLPLTFYLDPLSALAFLYVIGKSGRYGGSIAAILFNTPGTAASAATMQDGYPMAQSGRAGKALRTSTIASVFGDIFGDLILIFGAAFIAQYTIKFGPPEYFAIYVMAFLVIGSVISESIIMGIVSTLLGAYISLIGLDPISGDARMTFGFLELESGFSLVPLLIGLFVISEVFVQAEHSMKNASLPLLDSKGDDNHMTIGEFLRCIPVMLRSSTIGSFIGMMPGLGSSVACFVAYGEEKNRAKNKDEWGTGVVEGIAAPESANNAVSGPSMIPLLTLGVPGSTIAAILIGVFTIHGIQVGPRIFTTSGDLIYGLFAAGLLGIVVYGVFGYFAGPFIGKMIGRLKPQYIYPFIFMTGFIAAYSTRSSIFDVGVAFAFGIIGYVLRRVGLSIPAFVIAFVLAKGAEEAYRQSILMSRSGNLIFFERPIAVAFMGLAVFVIGMRIYRKRKAKTSQTA